MKLKVYSIFTILSVTFALCIVDVESKPILDQFRIGWDKTRDALHRLECKIKDHTSCHIEQIDSTIVLTTTISNPSDMIDVRAKDDDSENVIERVEEVAANIDSKERIGKIEGKAVIQVNTCAAGYRRDRTGKCREIA